MPSFDVVSEVDMHELTNAVDQANREVGTRYDFKGKDAKFELSDAVVTLKGESTFQLQQMVDIFYQKASKRSIDIGAFEQGPAETVGMGAQQKLTVRQGLDKEQAKKVVKLIKDKKLKVQAQIQGEQVRVTGKKRDDLQSVMAMLREAKLDQPLQYNNFRD
ncbi:YajQ family cyclic di-GMP-binding protein [Solemya pervernicosa gill symbiont]|uniref:Nucleotide-binding protein BOW53_14755 n=2 Tax=Gammaproteobacteria incertae sedis TaxID=118884 RepID=A0A1T2L0P1_9GAMM|nr:YajQ family cyclic di-GMP-binding protein [Candidatus Reidiella endopervernicosa]OOZ38651.1 YajQ family cyclic di-GMP-binding protein [Solemya pervernicosa gill symbiont]QKQ26020.1 YajQ family cyclic di-GMP-binding protein [Candidatus Reidiella endopervernicosa]